MRPSNPPTHYRSNVSMVRMSWRQPFSGRINQGVVVDGDEHGSD